MIWVDFVRNYIKTFCSKNLESLANDYYADDVKLRDWVVDVSGKDAVLEVNREFFEKVKNLRATIRNIAYNGKNVMMEFTLWVDDNPIEVVDVIKINEFGKIQSVTAYRR